MSERRFGRRGRWAWTALATMVATLWLIAPGLAGPASATPPVLPDSEWSSFLSAVTGPTLSPGGSGTLTFQVGDPLSQDLTSVSLYLQDYAFNPTDGGAPQSPTLGAAPTLGGGTLGWNVSVGLLTPGEHTAGSVPVTIPSPTSTGDYGFRFAVSFSVGNVSYLLESRGFFSAGAWAAATQYPNGTPTINASRLGVSGVVPETSVLVSSPSTPLVLYALLGVGLGLVAVGAYWWTRSGAKSRSGTRRSSPPQSAPTAFGRSRSNEGD